MDSTPPIFPFDYLPYDIQELILLKTDINDIRGVCREWRNWAISRTQRVVVARRVDVEAIKSSDLIALSQGSVAQRITDLDLQGCRSLCPKGYNVLSSFLSLERLSLATVDLSPETAAATFFSLSTVSPSDVHL